MKSRLLILLLVPLLLWPALVIADEPFTDLPAGRNIRPGLLASIYFEPADLARFTFLAEREIAEQGYTGALYRVEPENGRLVLAGVEVPPTL